MKPGPANILSEQRRPLLIVLLLTLSTLAVYWQVHGFDFTNLDEPTMIYQNPMVTGGLTLRGIYWGLTTSFFEYWHPVTWWSHMLDWQLFGANPGAHHLISLAFHIANTLILFAALRQLTGLDVRSAVVAALFALHPMHVESVVWLAERKDLLSTLFWLLSVWAYAAYAGVVRKDAAQAELFFRLSLFSFWLGIMSKPMVVTLPFVLLLLDYWPLNRSAECEVRSVEFKKAPLASIRSLPFVPLILEKIPYFGLAFISCLITLYDVKKGNNIASRDALPLSLRLANIPVSYARYLGKLLWPADLAAFYPMPDHWNFWQVGGSVLLFLFITGIVMVLARRAPYLVFGWFMFVGTIFPTISLVPVGFQSMADRYTYLTYIGLFVAGIWALAEYSVNWRFRVPLLAAIGAAVLVLCGALTWTQAGYWRNSLTLWPHTLAVTRNNLIAEYNFAYALDGAGRVSEAIEHFREVVRIKPDHVAGNISLGRALASAGRTKEATNYFAKALQRQPDLAMAHENMGIALLELGDYVGAIAHCSEAVRLNPGDYRAMLGLARSLGAQGKSDEAMSYYSAVLRLAPASAEPHYYLGLEQLKRSMLDEAVSSLSEAVRLDSSLIDARIQLDAALEKRRQLQQ